MAVEDIYIYSGSLVYSTTDNRDIYILPPCIEKVDLIPKILHVLFITWPLVRIFQTCKAGLTALSKQNSGLYKFSSDSMEVQVTGQRHRVSVVYWNEVVYIYMGVKIIILFLKWFLHDSITFILVL